MRPNITILTGAENTLFAEHLRWWREFYTVERRERGPSSQYKRVLEYLSRYGTR